MDIATIVQLLTNAGFNVKGVDATKTHLLIEDPSCIMRNFQTFLEYAWVIVSLIAAILLFGWAISKIRGAKTDIATNIRNLLIMFGTLSVTGPIINVIYGDDLMARTCHTLQISVSDVQKILDARNAQLSQNNNLFETIDIFDSGMRDQEIQYKDQAPIDVPEFNFAIDNITGEPNIIDNIPTPQPVDNHTPDAQPEPESAPAPTVTPLTPDNNIQPAITVNANAPRYARVISDKIIEYTRSDGTKYRNNGGSPAWRHNNPGNIINSAANNTVQLAVVKNLPYFRPRKSADKRLLPCYGHHHTPIYQ